MDEVLKPVPSIEGLVINHDGTLVYYKERLKNINYNHSGNKRYKCISIGNKGYAVSKLVYEAFIGPFPKSRKIKFIDGNHLNTHYMNLGPKPCLVGSIANMRKVPGYDELYVNNNGTVVMQYGYEINITTLNDERRGSINAGACVSSSKGANWVYMQHLVAKAWLGWSGRGKIFHTDGDTKNNHFKNLKPVSEKEFYKLNAVWLKHKGEPWRASKIPQSDQEKVKRRLLKGESLRAIANDYGCSDMAVVRFKNRVFTQEQIDHMNKAKGINTTPTPKEIVDEVVKLLKEGKRQIDVAKRFNLSPTVICRINRKFIREA